MKYLSFLSPSLSSCDLNILFTLVIASQSSSPHCSHRRPSSAITISTNHKVVTLPYSVQSRVDDTTTNKFISAVTIMGQGTTVKPLIGGISAQKQQPKSLNL